MRLLIRFVVLSFVAIVATTATLGFFLSSYLTRQMPYQDAIEATESLNALVHAEGAERGFREGSEGADTPEMAPVLRYLDHLPDVYLATIYRADGTMLWSSDKARNVLAPMDADQLAVALAGELNPQVRRLQSNGDHVRSGIPDDATSFVTFAIPIWSADTGHVIGAVEIRKVPETLLGSMDRVRRLTWAGEALAGTFLFLGLLLVILYTTRVLQRHEERLMERERLAVVGEMASSVAHGLRNPLAAIRSCAELALDDDLPESARGPVADIVEQSDRLESWIRSFLIRAREDPRRPAGHANVDQVVGRSLRNFRSQMQDRSVVADFDDGGRGPIVAARPNELEQVLNAVLSNSIEAMQTGGTIRISRDRRPDGQVRILIEDDGPGVPPEMVRRLFSPFESGKPSGLGVGLVLARQIVERLGGGLHLRNRENGGVAVTCTIPSYDGRP